MQFQELTTQRLRLRRIVHTDIEYVFSGLSNPEVITYYGVSFHSLQDTQEQMAFYEAQENDGTGQFWAVCSNETGAFLGVGGFNNWDKTHRKAEIGFWLLPDYWRRGYMQEAMSAIMDYGFKSMNLHRIEGFVETENRACIKSIEKIGFKYEGTMKECEWKNERFIDIAIYSKIQ